MHITPLFLTFKRFAVLSFIFTLTACAPQSTPTYFLPPTQPIEIIPTRIIIRVPTATFIPTPTVILTPTPCTNGLTFVKDITISDNTPFGPGQPVDKQWLATNSGTCNWDSNYRLKLIKRSCAGRGNRTGSLSRTGRRASYTSHRLHRAVRHGNLYEHVAGFRSKWGSVWRHNLYPNRCSMNRSDIDKYKTPSAFWMASLV